VPRNIVDDPSGEQVFRSHWQDGSLDLFGGVSAVGIGLCWLGDAVWAGAVVPMILIPFWSVWRRHFVEPRLEHVRLQPSQRRELRQGLITLFFLGCFTLLVALLSFFGFESIRSDPLVWLIPALPSILLGAASLFGGLILGLGRFVIYAAGFALAGLGVAALGLRPGIALATGGAITTLAASILFLRFIAKHPAAPVA